MRPSIPRLMRPQSFHNIIAPLRRPLAQQHQHQHPVSTPSISTPPSFLLHPSKTSSAPHRPFSSTPSRPQNQYSHPNPAPGPNFYRTHSRAFLKSFTLAFLTYQIAYWFWLTIEAEEIRDTKNAEIRALEGEVRLLEEGRRGHGRSGGILISQDGRDGDGDDDGREGGGKRLLEESTRASDGRKGRRHHRGHVDMEGDVDEREDT